MTRLPQRRLASLIALPLWLAAAAPAAAATAPLVELPVDKLAQMAPLLRHGEVALIESLPSGRMKQVTIISLVAAPPDLVRQVVLSPEKWPDFVPNLNRAQITRHADGSLDFDFQINLKVLSLQSNGHMAPRPDGSVLVNDSGPHDRSTQLWRFYAVAGGTVMVEYGYTDIYVANKYIRRVVDAAPLSEHGLALAAQLAYVRAMKLRSEKIAKPGSFAPADAKARGPGFNFLLDRGRVAVVRMTPEGHLADISIVDNIYAPAARVEEVLAKAGDYVHFLDGVKRSEIKSTEDGEIHYELRHDLSVIHLESSFRMRRAPNAVDVVGDSGDQKASHFRWDLTAKGEKQTLVVYRANQDLSSASPLILGTIFRAAPFLEPGIAVAFGLIYVVGVRGHAEGWR